MGGISGDPVALGLAASFARPAANVTGLTLSIVNASGDLGLAGKQMELLRELRPGLARIGVVFNPDDLVGKIYWKSAQEAARILKIDCAALEVRQRSDLEGVLAAGNREELAALLIPISPSITSVPDWVVQSVIIENLTGAAGTIGAAHVAHATPDGYTVILGHWQTHVVNGATFTLSFDVAASHPYAGGQGVAEHARLEGLVGELR